MIGALEFSMERRRSSATFCCRAPRFRALRKSIAIMPICKAEDSHCALEQTAVRLRFGQRFTITTRNILGLRKRQHHVSALPESVHKGDASFCMTVNCTARCSVAVATCCQVKTVRARRTSGNQLPE